MSCPYRRVVSRHSEYTFKNENRVWELELQLRSSINLVQYSLAERQLKGFKLVQQNMLTGQFWFDGTSSPYADINQNNPAQKQQDDKTKHDIKSNTSVLRLIEFFTWYKLSFRLSLCDVLNNIWVIKQIQSWTSVWISLHGHGPPRGRWPHLPETPASLPGQFSHFIVFGNRRNITTSLR